MDSATLQSLKFFLAAHCCLSGALGCCRRRLDRSRDQRCVGSLLSSAAAAVVDLVDGRRTLPADDDVQPAEHRLLAAKSALEGADPRH